MAGFWKSLRDLPLKALPMGKGGAVDLSRVRKVLVVRPDPRVGNVLLTTPLLRALKRGLPQAEVHLLLAADTLSDLEIPWLEEPAWIHRHSLERLQRVIEDEGVETLVPGHGAIAEGAAACRRRVHDDLDYLRRLEQGVADAVARGDSLERTQEVLAAMPYTGRDAAYAMNDVHRGNIAHTWHGLRARGGHADA